MEIWQIVQYVERSSSREKESSGYSVDIHFTSPVGNKSYKGDRLMDSRHVAYAVAAAHPAAWDYIDPNLITQVMLSGIQVPNTLANTPPQAPGMQTYPTPVAPPTQLHPVQHHALGTPRSVVAILEDLSATEMSVPSDEAAETIDGPSLIVYPETVADWELWSLTPQGCITGNNEQQKQSSWKSWPDAAPAGAPARRGVCKPRPFTNKNVTHRFVGLESWKLERQQ
jgi:hypothetical protein